MFAPFRPKAPLPCEHVFCSARTSTLTQRAREALALARAFLLLEDDETVGWEVDQEERIAERPEPEWARAHRASLRTGLAGGALDRWSCTAAGRGRASRRGGQPAPPPQVCLCPVESGARHRTAATPEPARGLTWRHPASRAAADAGAAQRGSRITTGSSRVAIER